MVDSAHNKSIKKILILVAMQAEADPIIDSLNLVESNELSDGFLPFKFYKKTSESQQLILLTSGKDPRYNVDNIGTQAATLMAYVGIEGCTPDLVISAGTAGGFEKKGACIGTVYLSDEEFIFHDRNVPLPGFDVQGVGHYPALNVRGMAAALSLPIGKISSGSSFKKDAEHLAKISNSGAVAKEMEVAAIGWVCWLKNIPLIAVKSITNLLDGQESSEEQFMFNFNSAAHQLSIELKNIISFIENKNLADLSE